jgi:hypothetical protein
MVLVNGGIQSMFTKLRSVGISVLTSGVLVAGAVGLSGQSPRPAPRPDPLVAPAGTPVEVVAEVVLDRVDAAEHVAKLARTAQRQEAEGDLKAAAKTLQDVESFAQNWRQRVMQQAEHDLKRDERFRAEYDRKRADAADRGMAPALPLSRTPEQANLETRMRALEDKVERLLKMMDEGRAKPRPNEAK